MKLRRPNWYVYLGRDPWSWRFILAWGFRPAAPDNEIPWDHLIDWSTRCWPRLIWASRPIGYRSHIVPIGFQAFGRHFVLWRY
jgi:hypothetical protein